MTHTFRRAEMTVPAFSCAAPRVARDDPARRLLGAHFEARSFAPCRAAAPRIALPARLGSDADLLALAALAIAQTFGLLDAERAGQVGETVRESLDGGADRALAAASAETVLTWCTAMNEWCERNGLDREFSRLQPRAAIADADPGASAAARVHWRVAAAWHQEAFCRRAEVAALLDEAEAMAAQAGDLGLQVVVWLHRARLALSRSAPEKALALARRAAAHASERESPLWLADAADITARAALMQGDMHRALHQARRAVALAEIAQATPAYAMTYRLYESYALLGLGAYDEALALIRELAARHQPSFLTERQRLLARIYALVRDDHSGRWSESSRTELAAVVGRLRELAWPGVLALLPQLVARLWARALDAGIETDWVRASIRNRDLPPPEPSWPAAWPWDVRVSVLGTFSCVVDGRELDAGPSGKAAAKPLALLRRLAVEGGHDGVAADALARALWPGEGREGRDKALETTLSRLRRLLGRADAVLLHERRLRLNPQRVWLDSAALARQLDRLQRPARAGAPEVDAERAWDAALALSRGPLLADEGDAPWIEPARDRLRARLAAALHDHAKREGHRARCLRAIAADPALERLL